MDTADYEELTRCQKCITTSKPIFQNPYIVLPAVILYLMFLIAGAVLLALLWSNNIAKGFGFLLVIVGSIGIIGFLCIASYYKDMDEEAGYHYGRTDVYGREREPNYCGPPPPVTRWARDKDDVQTPLR